MSQQNPHLPRHPERAANQAERQRQFELDAITAHYVEEYLSGKKPQLEHYTQQYPQFAREIAAFVFYYHAVDEHLPAPEATSAAHLSTGAQRALERIRSHRAAAAGSAAAETGAATEPIDRIVTRGIARGILPPQLAAAVGLSQDVLARLDARVIAANSIPRSLIDRLAKTLQVAPAAITEYFNGTGQVAGGFYYAERQPEQQQQSFLDAVRASTLDDEQKQQWEDIVRNEVSGGQ